jgi:hypothetical protein
MKRLNFRLVKQQGRSLGVTFGRKTSEEASSTGSPIGASAGKTTGHRIPLPTTGYPFFQGGGEKRDHQLMMPGKMKPLTAFGGRPADNIG